MKVSKLIGLLIIQRIFHGNCDVRIEIKCPNMLDPTFSAVASEPKDVVWTETGNSSSVIAIMDF